MASADDKPGVFELRWYQYDKLEELFRLFKEKNSGEFEAQIYDYDKNQFGPYKNYDLSKKILVLEGIFLFHPRHNISKLFDKKIYMETDFDIADGRRVVREKERWGDKYVSEDHPDSFVKQFKIAYRRYIKENNPAKSVDLVVR